MAGRSSQGSALRRDTRALAETHLHPARGQILTALSERPDVTVREIAERLGLSPRRVRHHLEAMLAANLIEVTSGPAKPRRYGTESFTFEEWAPLTIEARAAIVRDIVRLLLRDISAAASAGTFGTRTDDHTVRMYGEVDDACFDELATLHWRVYREMGEAMESARGRMATAREPGTEIISALFFFEAPLWGDIGSPRPAKGAPKAPPRQGQAGLPALPRRFPSTPSAPEMIAAARADPVRSRVLNAMAERPGVSIREIGEKIGEPPRRVRYQVDALLAEGLATVTSEELHRGVIERRFGAGSLLIDEIAPLDLETRASLAREVAVLLLSDVAAAEAASTFGKHESEFEVRFYGEADEACLEALADIHRRAHPEIQATIEVGRERLRVSGRRGTEVVSALFFFEAPVWTAAKPRD